MPPHWMMSGAYSFLVFRMTVHPSVQMCVRTYIHMYVHDPVKTQVKAFVPGRILQFYSHVPLSGGIHVLWTDF